METPRHVDDLPALAAFLLGGSSGRPLSPAARARLGLDDAAAEAAAVAEFLAVRRIAAEAAASGRLAESGLARATRLALALERERVGAAAATRRRALETCGAALARAGLVAMLYKGEAVVRLTHGDPSRRPMADLDVVVDARARAAARQALLGAGFVPTTADSAMHDVLLHPAPGAGHPHGVAVEVHGDVFPPPHPFGLDLPGMLARAAPSGLPGLALPDRADAIILSCAHLALHERDGRKSLLALRDLALLGERLDGSGADALRERAAAADLAPVVAAALARSAAFAGGRGDLAAPGAPGAPGASPSRFRRASGRRSLALALVVRELDAGLASSDPPRRRMLPARLAAALWHERLADSARALWRSGVVGADVPAERRRGRLGRLVRGYLGALTRRGA